jgi:hypothetical protein
MNLGSTKEGSVLHIEKTVFDRTVHRYGKTSYEVRSTEWRTWLEAILLQRTYENMEMLLDGIMTNDTTAGATDTLNGGIDADDTIITLTDITGFTEPGNHGFVVKIGTEEILVRGVDETTDKLGTTALPCVRGYNGTTAASHLTGVTVTMCGTVIDTDPRPKARTKGSLTLRPVGESDDTNAWTMWQAEILSKFSPALKVDEDQGYECEIKGVLEESATGKIRLLRLGKTDILTDESWF